MAQCCDAADAAGPKKHVCPVNGKAYSEVPIGTVLHHVAQPWRWSHPDQAYYFCDDPECDVVYFGRDNTTIGTALVRTSVGVKQKSETALVCYCFGVNRRESVQYPDIKAFVIEQTKNGICSCLRSNPSGRCCLKDFPGSRG